ncbi:MAG TPA: DUF2795 domain-containing protein [Beutenbergiaceae bacterium]|nr:DUF2795 domain-containing protein [Beutenbergiaceae bacterium]
MSADTGMRRLKEILGEVTFPAGKETIVDHATDSGADEEVLRAVRAMPPVEYDRPEEVLRSVPLDEDTPDTPSTEAERAQQRREHVRGRQATSTTDPGPVNPIEEELGENRKS